MTQTHSFPEPLVRIGLFAEWFELRLGYNYLAQPRKTAAAPPTKLSGSEDMLVAAKVAFAKQRGILPDLSIFPQLRIPTGSPGITAGECLPGVNIAYAWAVMPRLELECNSVFNRRRDETGHFYVEYLQTANLEYDLGQKWRMFTEYLHFCPLSALEARHQHYFHAGVQYFVAPNFQIDLHSAVGLNAAATDLAFTGIGFCFRRNHVWKRRLIASPSARGHGRPVRCQHDPQRFGAAQFPTLELSMNRLRCLGLWVIAAVASPSSPVCAQNSAPSSHFVFDDNFSGDILIHEVRVPKSGEATYTYYEALGWRGKGAGYAGIQAHPQSHLFIFSIWDHKEHSAPIKAAHRGPGTKTVGFGGEGTGLKSWNFDLGWSTDVWYTLVARHWPVGDHTYFGFWSRAGDTRKWTHLVTMDVAAKATFEGGTDAFIEDWSNTGAKPRATHLRGGWKRKSDGAWFPFGVGRYSVNAWDLEPGKRSYNYRTNWNGGVQRDETGEFYFMLSGGADSAATTENPSKFAIKRTATEPSFEKLKIRDAKLALMDGKTLSLTWDVDDTTTPPFAYDIKLFDNAAGRGEPLATAANNGPHVRSAMIDVSSLKLSGGRYYARLQCHDILDRTSEVAVLPFPPTGK